jgi:hypothetical protein
MKDPKELENLLESFLSENHIEDAGFSDQVMAKVSEKPKIAFLTNLYPVLGGLFGLLLLVLSKQTFGSMSLRFNLKSFKPLAQIFENSDKASQLMSAYGTYIGIAAFAGIALFLTLKKEKI